MLDKEQMLYDNYKRKEDQINQKIVGIERIIGLFLTLIGIVYGIGIKERVNELFIFIPFIIIIFAYYFTLNIIQLKYLQRYIEKNEKRIWLQVKEGSSTWHKYHNKKKRKYNYLKKMILIMAFSYLLFTVHYCLFYISFNMNVIYFYLVFIPVILLSIILCYTYYKFNLFDLFDLLFAYNYHKASVLCLAY